MDFKLRASFFMKLLKFSKKNSLATNYAFENELYRLLKCFAIKISKFKSLTKHLFHSNQQISMTRTSSVSMFIIISCGCCFLQSTIAFVILLPNIYIRRCYISILKMQFCVSISITMTFLILGLLKYLPQVSTNTLLSFTHYIKVFTKVLQHCY